MITGRITWHEDYDETLLVITVTKLLIKMCYNAGIELINPLGDRFPPIVQANAMQRPVAPVRTMDAPDRWEPMRWLLIPPGIRDSARLSTLRIWLANARVEELERKPLFRSLLAEHRCVARFSWFYEWRHEAGTKTRYRVRLEDGTPMLLPGLYRLAAVDGVEYASFTVCTMEAQGIMRHIHNSRLRQPVVVDEDGASAWLNRTVPFEQARSETLRRELSVSFVPDPPIQEDLFGNPV